MSTKKLKRWPPQERRTDPAGRAPAQTTASSPAWLGRTGRGGAYDSGITGEGVVVGIIDNGIWPKHPSFADDSSYRPLPIPPLDTTRPSCEFGNTAGSPKDAPFTCNNKLLGSRQMLHTYRALTGIDPDEFARPGTTTGTTPTPPRRRPAAGVEASPPQNVVLLLGC